MDDYIQNDGYRDTAATVYALVNIMGREGGEYACVVEEWARKHKAITAKRIEEAKSNLHRLSTISTTSGGPKVTMLGLPVPARGAKDNIIAGEWERKNLVVDAGNVKATLESIEKHEVMLAKEIVSLIPPELQACT